MLRIAVPKGRLEEGIVNLLRKMGYDLDRVSDLVFKSQELVCFFVRPFDVPTYLVNGAADVGFCGTDVLIESQVSLIQPFFLPSGRSRMVLAGPRGKGIPTGEVRIATKFPNIARRYCESRGLSCRIIPLKGSVELGPISGLSDLIIDITETGRTLRENDLEVLDEIFEIRTHVVVNPVSYRTKRRVVLDFLSRLRRVLEDEGFQESVQ